MEKQKTKKKRSSLNSESYVCEFCKAKYKRIKAYNNHLEECQILLRLMEMEDEPILYFIWKKVSYQRKTEFEEKVKFAKTSYYKSISEFIKSAKRVRWNFLQEYIEWLINNNVKFSMWKNYLQYSKFLKSFIMMELPRDAIERSIKYIGEQGKFGKYFKTEHVERFLLDIEAGSISPWLVLLYDKNDDLFNRMDVSQFYRFQKTVKPEVWSSKIGRMQKSTEALRSELLDCEI